MNILHKQRIFNNELYNFLKERKALKNKMNRCGAQRITKKYIHVPKSFVIDDRIKQNQEEREYIKQEYKYSVQVTISTVINAVCTNEIWQNGHHQAYFFFFIYVVCVSQLTIVCIMEYVWVRC